MRERGKAVDVFHWNERAKGYATVFTVDLESKTWTSQTDISAFEVLPKTVEGMLGKYVLHADGTVRIITLFATRRAGR